MQFLPRGNRLGIQDDKEILEVSNFGDMSVVPITLLSSALHAGKEYSVH